MMLRKALYMLLACVVVSFAANSVTEGNGNMVKSGGEKGSSQAMTVVGTLEKIDSTDSMILIKSQAGMLDTLKLSAKTSVPKGKAALKDGEAVTAHYKMVNGKKEAIRVMATKQGEGSKKGTMKKGEGSKKGVMTKQGEGSKGSMSIMGTLEKVDLADSMIYIKSKAGKVDTLKLGANTVLPKGKTALRDGESVVAHYKMINGQKQATRVMAHKTGEGNKKGTMSKQGEGSKKGTIEKHQGTMGTDTVGTMNKQSGKKAGEGKGMSKDTANRSSSEGKEY